ncbi:MAG: RNA-binding cell elongation regulator Jag/EloR [Dehalococcoidia bacterium]
MQNQSLERTGKTVDEAIELAVLELGVGRDEVEVDVISKGRAGILGIGSEPAKVRVRLITGGVGNAGDGLDVVANLLEAMQVDAQPTIRSSGDEDAPAVIDIQGEDAGLIIGHHGETLRAFQFVTNLILSREQGGPSNVVVDVEQYRERRAVQLRTLAQRMAERAISSGRPVVLEPMPPAERRIVHIALAEHKGVTTESSGEGNQRRVTILPVGASGRPAGGPGRTSGSNARPAARRRPPRDREQD